MDYSTLYKDYSARYDRMEKQTELPMAMLKFSKRTFSDMFQPQRMELEERMGRRVSDSEVIREFLYRNKYGSSVRQGSALQQAAAKLGINISEEEARKWSAQVARWKEDKIPIPLDEITNPEVRKFYALQQAKIDEYWAKFPAGTKEGLKNFIAHEIWGS